MAGILTLTVTKGVIGPCGLCWTEWPLCEVVRSWAFGDSEVNPPATALQSPGLAKPTTQSHLTG